MTLARTLLITALLFLTIIRTSGAAEPAFYELPIDFRGLYQGSCDWGDFDQDGDPDIILSGLHSAGSFTSTPETRFFRNDRNRTFTDMGISLKGLYSGAIAWADTDSDGNLDIMVTGSDTSSKFTKIYRFFTQEANRTFIEISHPFPAVSDGSIAWGDYDGDSDQDLLLAGDTGLGSVVALYRSRPAGTFEEPWRREFDQIDLSGLIPSLFGPIAKWFDYDVDGRLDIIVSGERAVERTPYLALLRNTGTSFIEVTDSGLPQVDANSMTWADYDNDGEPDLLLQGTTTGGAFFAKVYRNRSGEISDVEFVEHAISLFPQFSNLSSIGAWGDFNADGYKDFIAGGGLPAGDTGPLETANRVFFSSNTLAFAAGSTLGISPSMSISCAAPADYDLDGDIDLFLSGYVGQIPIASVFESYRKASAGGTITNAASTGIAGVTVRLIDSSGMTTTTTTNTDGTYRLDNILRGTYTIEPVMEGYTFTPATIALEMTDADSTANNFSIPGAGPLPTAAPGEAPDVGIKSFSHPTVFGTGSAVKFTVVFTNKEAKTGRSATWAGTFSSAIYLSQNKLFDASDLRLKVFKVAMGSNKEKTVVVTLRPGSKIKKGKRYYPIVMADSASKVLEVSESNNVKISSRSLKRR